MQSKKTPPPRVSRTAECIDRVREEKRISYFSISYFPISPSLSVYTRFQTRSWGLELRWLGRGSWGTRRGDAGEVVADGAWAMIGRESPIAVLTVVMLVRTTGGNTSSYEE